MGLVLRQQKTFFFKSDFPLFSRSLFLPHSDHPLSALSHGNVSVVSSFNIGGVGDAFSDCVAGDRTM